MSVILVYCTPIDHRESRMNKFRVLVYGSGSNQMPTKVREYTTWKQAVRYADAQRARSICAVAERIDA